MNAINTFSLTFNSGLNLFVEKITVSFTLIYSLVLISGILYFFIVGYKNKYPPASWSVIITAIIIFFLTGLKIWAYPFSQWDNIFLGNYHSVSYIKYAPAGLLFALAGTVIIKQILRFRPSITDTFIVFLPVMEIVQRIGCLLNGCCYGKPTSLPWAIHYSENFAVYHRHVERGLIDPTVQDFCSVHPTQLYSILGCVLVLIILWKTRNWFKVAGNRSLWGLSLLALVRFTVEFWRDPDKNLWFSGTWQGLTLLQSAILSLVSGFCIIIYFREKLGTVIIHKKIPASEKPFSCLLIVICLLIIFWQLREIYDFNEVIIIAGMIALSLLMSAMALFKEIIIPRFRGITVSLILISFICMSQQMIVDSTGNNRIRKNWGWISTGFNAAGGNYAIKYRNCEGDIIGQDVYKFSFVGGDIAYNLLPTPNQYLRAGINYYWQKDCMTEKYTITDDHYYRSMVINPFIKYDFKWIGIGIGGHVPLYEKYSPSAKDIVKLNTSYSVRLGRRDLLFAEVSCMDEYYRHGEYGYFEAAIGTGFGKLNKNSFKIGAGIFTLLDQKPVFMEGQIFLDKNISLRPAIAFGSRVSGSIGFQVHFGKNKWKPLRE